MCIFHNLFKYIRFGLWPYFLFGTIFFFAILGLVMVGFLVASAKLLLSVMDVGLCGGLLNSSFSTLIFSDGTLPLLFLVPALAVALSEAALVVLAFGLVPALAAGLTVVFTAEGAGGLGLAPCRVVFLDAPAEGGADGGTDAPVDTGAGAGVGGGGTLSAFSSALELPA